MARINTYRFGINTVLCLTLVTLASLLFFAFHSDQVLNVKNSTKGNGSRKMQQISIGKLQKDVSLLKNDELFSNKQEEITFPLGNPVKLVKNISKQKNKTVRLTTRQKMTPSPSKTGSDKSLKLSTKTSLVVSSKTQTEVVDASNTKSRYLIYLCDKRRSCGGWADRQRGIVAAYLMATVTGRRFGLNMSYPCDVKLFYIPNEINWYVRHSEIQGLSWETVDWMDNKNHSVDCESNFNKRHNSDVVFLRTNQDVIRRIVRSKRYGHLVPAEYRTKDAWAVGWDKLMRPSLYLEEHIDKFMDGIPRHTNLICAHVRMRKSPSIRNDAAAINSVSALKSLWTFLSKYRKSASRIFIATDSLEVRTMARKELGEKELDTDGVVLHVDRQGRVSNACLGFEMALLDQAVLTRCNVLVVSRSGFSIRAAMMSHLDQELFMFNNGTISPWTK